MMVESLKENLALGNYEKVRKLVRFLADLVNSKVVASASIMSLFDTFITVTYEPDIPQVSVSVCISVFVSMYACLNFHAHVWCMHVCPCVCVCAHTRHTCMLAHVCTHVGWGICILPTDTI